MSKGIHMKQLIELFRLYFELGYSQRDIAKMIRISKTTVHNYIEAFTSSGLVWPLPQEYLEHDKLLIKLNKNGGKLNSGIGAEIDFIEVHHELKAHKNVTLKLLWEEMKLAGVVNYSYEYFTIKYNKWLGHQPSSMRQSHKGGEKVFVDYSGDKIAIYDSGDLSKILYYAEVFVGVLGASKYIYLEATQSQKTSDWTMSHVRMFEHFETAQNFV